jgi:hypothetical protein
MFVKYKSAVVSTTLLIIIVFYVIGTFKYNKKKFL